MTTKQDIKEPRKAEVIPNVEDPDEANKEQTLYKCPNCGRSFKREAYAKHVPICQRVFHSKDEQDKKAKEKEKEKEKDKKWKKKDLLKIKMGEPKWWTKSNYSI